MRVLKAFAIYGIGIPAAGLAASAIHHFIGGPTVIYGFLLGFPVGVWGMLTLLG